eukprot:SAG31_NODE_23128_length_510_cov_1.377129_2_plen_56_part_01
MANVDETKIKRYKQLGFVPMQSPDFRMCGWAPRGPPLFKLPCSMSGETLELPASGL